MSLTDLIRSRLSTDAAYTSSEHVLRCAATYNQTLTAVLDECARLTLVATGLGIDQDPCPYTQAHTRNFCGRPGCREA